MQEEEKTEKDTRKAPIGHCQYLIAQGHCPLPSPSPRIWNKCKWMNRKSFTKNGPPTRCSLWGRDSVKLKLGGGAAAPTLGGSNQLGGVKLERDIWLPSGEPGCVTQRSAGARECRLWRAAKLHYGRWMKWENSCRIPSTNISDSSDDRKPTHPTE